MGAGNRYRLTEDDELPAAFILGDCYCEVENRGICDCWENIREDLMQVISEHPQVKKYGMRDDRESFYYGELFIVTFECGNHNEIVIQFEYDSNCPDHMHMLNYEKCYHSLIKHVNKHYPVYEGFGYTSARYEIGEYGK